MGLFCLRPLRCWLLAASSGFCQVMRHVSSSDSLLEPSALGKESGQARPPSWDFLFEEAVAVVNNVVGCQHPRSPSDREKCGLQELSESVSLTSGSI